MISHQMYVALGATTQILMATFGDAALLCRVSGNHVFAAYKKVPHQTQPRHLACLWGSG